MAETLNAMQRFKLRYLQKHGVPYDPKRQPSYRKARGKKPIKKNYRLPRIKITKGVHKKCGCWYATITVDTIKTSKGFSISKLGDKGAKLAATLQRMVWLIDKKVWNPEEGDPLKIISYLELTQHSSPTEDPWSAPEEEYQ